MRAHPQRFSGIDDALDEAYMTTMRQPAQHAGQVERWGGGPELAALSRALRRTIVVHSTNAPEVTFREEGEPEFSSQGTIHILFRGGNHYSAYQPH